MWEETRQNQFLFENQSQAWRQGKKSVETPCRPPSPCWVFCQPPPPTPLHSRSGPHWRCFKWSQDVLATAGVSQGSRVLFHLFSGQVSSQEEAKWETWSVRHLLPPRAVGTWPVVAGASPHKPWRLHRRTGTQVKVTTTQVGRMDSPSAQAVMTARHSTLPGTEERTKMAKEPPASNSERKLQYRWPPPHREWSPYKERKHPLWKGAGSVECLPRQLIASNHLPRSAVVKRKQGKAKLPGEELTLAV